MSEVLAISTVRFIKDCPVRGSTSSGNARSTSVICLLYTSQRLCIARALLKKPKVLILDDSTSAVDTRTDALIRQGFREFIPETTKIIIAQRVASVQDADRIVVMLSLIHI